MNREILFKAKRKDNGEWVEGGYFSEPYTEKKFIICWNSFGLGFNEFIEVEPDTICQYTGLVDKNGKKIWENDIIADGGNYYKVYWSEQYCNFSCECIKTDEPVFKGRKWDLWTIMQTEEVYVKGNVFDKNELLEVE